MPKQYTKREAIKTFGGGFIGALLAAVEDPSLQTLREAYIRADQDNRHRLRSSFEEIEYVARQTYDKWPASTAYCHRELRNEPGVRKLTQWKTLEYFRGDLKCPHTAVILLTAYAEEICDETALQKIEEHFPMASLVVSYWEQWPEIDEGVRSAFPGMKYLDEIVDDPIEYTSSGYKHKPTNSSGKG